METAPFSDPDGDAFRCSDWQIVDSATDVIAWQNLCETANPFHVHFGDGQFVNDYAGRTALNYDADYLLRVRHSDDSGDPATEWSAWAERPFHTAVAPPPGSATAWTARQTGYR